jgi:integrase
VSAKKKWQGRIFLGRDENGKQQYHWVGRGYRTRKERDEAVARERVRLETEGCECKGCKAMGNRGPSRSSLPTVGEQVDRYLADYKKRTRTSSMHSQETRLRPFRKDFADFRLDQVSRADIKDWAAGEGRWSEQGPASPSHLQGIVSFWNWTIVEDEKPITKNPARGMGVRTKGRGEQAPPTEKEFDQLIEGCAALGAYAPMMRALFLFAAFELMRPSELFELKESDVDFRRSRIAKSRRLYRGDVDEPKTGRKVIALTPPSRKVIAPILPGDGGYIFRNKSGDQLKQAMLNLYWGKVTARAGLDFDFYHATKHYGVWYFWTQLGLSDRAIAAQAGWSLKTVDKMLETYGHGVVGALEEVDAAFEGRDVPGLRLVEGGRQ